MRKVEKFYIDPMYSHVYVRFEGDTGWCLVEPVVGGGWNWDEQRAASMKRLRPTTRLYATMRGATIWLDPPD